MDCEELFQFRNGFAMIETIGDSSECEGLNFGDGLIARFAINHDAWKIGNLPNPAAIFFSFNFNNHIHHL